MRLLPSSTFVLSFVIFILNHTVFANCNRALSRLNDPKPHIVFLGYGGVAKATLPILQKKIPHSGVTVIDFENRSADLAPLKSQGVTFSQTKITPENLGATLSKHLKSGDVLVDLAWNIDIKELLTWCKENGVNYVNTSVEVWDPYGMHDAPPAEHTLYHRHQDLEKFTQNWGKNTPTAILEHGANPGWISHAAKQGILDLADRHIQDGAPESQSEEFKQAYRSKQFNQLARLMNVKVIHISELDSQISNRPRDVNEFVNTWSPGGFHEEGIVGAELGWGTHEKKLPEGASQHASGPKNQIFLEGRGINTYVKSVVPGHNILGMVVRHGEADTLSRFLTVEKEGKPIYRPTVHYAYQPSDAAITSLNWLRANNYIYPNQTRVMNNDITKGSDILGALLMGHRYKSWWTGSDLSIEEARSLVPGQNATTIQVAAAVTAAVDYMVKNKNKGILYPEDLPHDEILNYAKPYLGKWISEPIDWTPLKGQEKESKEDKDQDPWQFESFLFKNR